MQGLQGKCLRGLETCLEQRQEAREEAGVVGPEAEDRVLSWAVVMGPTWEGETCQKKCSERVSPPGSQGKNFSSTPLPLDCCKNLITAFLLPHIPCGLVSKSSQIPKNCKTMAHDSSFLLRSSQRQPWQPSQSERQILPVALKAPYDLVSLSL